MKIITRQSVVFFMTGFMALNASASDDFQFYIGSGYQHLDIEGSGSGDTVSIEAGGYSSSVGLNRGLPFGEVDDWAKNIKVSLNAFGSQKSDLGIIRGGTNLDESELKGGDLNLRLADETIPVWLSYGFSYTDQEKLTLLSSLGNGTQSAVELERKSLSEHLWRVGWYVDKTISISAGISRYNVEDVLSYSFAMETLFPVAQQHLGVDISYERLDAADPTFTIITGTTTLGHSFVDTDTYSFKGLYYPNRSLGIMLGYKKSESEQTRIEQFQVSGEYFINPKMSINAQLSFDKPDTNLARTSPKQTAYALDFTFRF